MPAEHRNADQRLPDSHRPISRGPDQRLLHGPPILGPVLGTPSYMAPEQAAGSKGVGPAADTYALGAILYDLLTGRPPFRGENELDTLIQVTTEDPVPPRSLQPKIPRDLETICLKCLEKQPQRRYETSAALADDLARFLAGQPIQDRPVGGLERAVKWTRRKPALAALAFVIVIAAAARSWSVGRSHTARLGEALQQTEIARTEAEQSAKVAREQKDAADRQSQRAAANFRRARAAVDQMLTRIAQEELANLPQMESLREAVLSDALRFYEDFLKEKGDDPEVRQEAGRAYRRIGDIDQLLNKHEDARTAYGQAMALQQKLVAEFPNAAPYRQELAGSYHHRANMWAALGEAQKGEADYGRARELRAKLVEEVPTNQRFPTRPGFPVQQPGNAAPGKRPNGGGPARLQRSPRPAGETSRPGTRVPAGIGGHFQ